jgi:hypothetical protein
MLVKMLGKMAPLVAKYLGSEAKLPVFAHQTITCKTLANYLPFSVPTLVKRGQYMCTAIVVVKIE